METVIYTVQKGDTLSSIAKRFGTTVGIITRYNGIIEPDMIYAGQILRIPVSEIPCRKKSCPPVMEYIVKKGDTLADIAIRFGSGVSGIAELNGLDDPDMIMEGQVLKIPTVKDYTIQRGDTLGRISEKTDVSVERLAEENKISDPDVIIAGETLKIPESDDEPTEYMVKSGDTLWKIAREYGVSVAYLINMNRLINPDCLMEGQIIVIK